MMFLSIYLFILQTVFDTNLSLADRNMEHVPHSESTHRFVEKTDTKTNSYISNVTPRNSIIITNNK